MFSTNAIGALIGSGNYFTIGQVLQGEVKQSIDEQVGYVLDIPYNELLI